MGGTGGANGQNMGAAPQANLDLDRCRRRYVDNLAALYRRDPSLAAQLETIPFAALPQLEAARDGNVTVRLTADDGQSIYAHSKVRPVDQARKLVDALPPADHATFVVFGPGLGYVLSVLAERYDHPLVIVCEDDLALLKASLCLHDFAGWIDEGRMIFLHTSDKASLTEKLMRANADVLLGLRYVTPPHARRYHAEFHRQITQALADFATTARTQIVTLLRTARVTIQNVAYNTARYVDQPGAEVLTDRARGFPAVVVAAGPSLIRNVDQLVALQDRAVVICVQTIFKLLRSLSICPHFVTSLDYHEVSAEFFHGIDDVGRCTLVAEPKATWHVLDCYPGRRLVLHHRAYETLLGESCPAHAELKAGTTVAHLAFYLAQHLGCDPIIFVGQDLAFSDGVYYLPGAPIEQTWATELGRFQTVEMKQWERIVRNRPILRRTRDLHDRPIYTDDVLFTFAEQFEADFADCPARIIQASEGGLPLRGSEIMPLSAAAERYCQRRLPADLFAFDWPTVSSEHKRQLAKSLEQRIAELEAMRAIAVEMRDLLDKLTTLLDKPAEFNHAIVRVDELRTLIQKYEAVYKLVVEVSSSAELRRHSADRRIGTVQRETRETARQRLARDRDFVNEFVAGCDFLGRVLPEALRRLEDQLP